MYVISLASAIGLGPEFLPSTISLPAEDRDTPVHSKWHQFLLECRYIVLTMQDGVVEDALIVNYAAALGCD